MMSSHASDGSCIPIRAPRHTNSTSMFDIHAPGHYCVVEDLHARWDFADHSAEGTLITINSDDVVLDLQGHTLGRGRLFKSSGSGDGISINGHRKNITIKNGIIRDFWCALYLADTYDLGAPDAANKENEDRFPPKQLYEIPKTNIIIESITFKNNDREIFIYGSNNIIRNNKIIRTENSGVKADGTAGPFAYGPFGRGTRATIIAHGSSNRIENNEIILTAKNYGFQSTAIYLRDGDGTVISGNKIVNKNEDQRNTSGIVLRNTKKVVIENNNISDVEKDIVIIREPEERSVKKN